MTSKRASLLTVKSLTALSKVCYVGNPSDAIRTLNLLRSLSTAIERSEFQNPNGYNIDESSEFNQKPSSFNTESQNLKGLQQNTNWQGLNSNGGLQQDQIRDHGWNPDGQHGSSSGVSGQSYGSQQNLYQNCGDGYTDGRSEYQNRFSGQNGTFDGYHGQNYGNLKRSPSVIHMENSREFEQNTNHFQNHGGVYEEGTRIDSHQNTNWQVPNPNGGVQQGPTRNYGWNPAGQHWNHSGVYGQSYGGSQQNFYQSSTDGYRVVRNKHPNDMSGQSGTFNGCHEQNDGTLKQSPSGVYMESPREFEQNSNHFHQNHGGVHEEGKRNDSLEEFDDFVKEGRLKEAVEVLGSLEKLSVPVVFSRIFQLMEACGDANALEEAKAVHQYILRSPCLIKVSTYNRILKMYSKCGSMDDAFDVFNNMRERNLTTWDTMITWLAKNGLGEDAVDLFSQFKQAGLKPDGQMFIGVFSACGTLGDIHEGMLHFKSMSDDYGIVPSMKHYISIVDMLGSTGYLDEALEFIGKMPMEPSVDIWETLMNLSRIHGNLELGDRCAETIELLDPSRLNEKSKAGLIPVDDLELAKEKEKKKLANRDLLEVRSRVHEYRAGDTSHPQTDKIYAQIRGLKAQMKEAGYIPETRFVLHDIDQEGKEEALLAHSERLAVSHGLLSSPPRAPIRIIKNLRVCGDCHSALKIISKIVGRELIIRDAKRFHHFKDGLCSCRDYW